MNKILCRGCGLPTAEDKMAVCGQLCTDCSELRAERAARLAVVGVRADEPAVCEVAKHDEIKPEEFRDWEFSADKGDRSIQAVPASAPAWSASRRAADLERAFGSKIMETIIASGQPDRDCDILDPAGVTVGVDMKRLPPTKPVSITEKNVSDLRKLFGDDKHNDPSPAVNLLDTVPSVCPFCNVGKRVMDMTNGQYTGQLEMHLHTSFKRDSVMMVCRNCNETWEHSMCYRERVVDACGGVHSGTAIGWQKDDKSRSGWTLAVNAYTGAVVRMNGPMSEKCGGYLVPPAVSDELDKYFVFARHYIPDLTLTEADELARLKIAADRLVNAQLSVPASVVGEPSSSGYSSMLADSKPWRLRDGPRGATKPRTCRSTGWWIGDSRKLKTLAVSGELLCSILSMRIVDDVLTGMRISSTGMPADARIVGCRMIQDGTGRGDVELTIWSETFPEVPDGEKPAGMSVKITQAKDESAAYRTRTEPWQ